MPEIKGKVYEVGQTVQATESLTKREIIIEYIENPQYPEYLKFEMINDKTSLIDNVRPGQDVEVFFNLRGRPWTDKTGKKVYFNSLQLWKINILGGAAAPAANTGYSTGTSSSSDDDDLPF